MTEPLDIDVAYPPAISLSFGPVAPAAAPPSSPGTYGASFTKQSEGVLSALRVVRFSGAGGVLAADPTVPADAGLIAGLAVTAAGGAGQPINVVRLGEVEDAAWAWTPNAPVYLGAGGALTQAYSPAWAFVLVVGVALTATRIVVDLREPIFQ